MKTKLNEYLSGGLDVLPKKKGINVDNSGEYFLITWHESKDEIHFMLMDMIHYDIVDKAIGKILRKEDPNTKKWSEIISSRQDFIDNFLAFCYKSQTYPKGRKTEFWIQTYCDEEWPFNDYDILRIIYIPEIGK